MTTDDDKEMCEYITKRLRKSLGLPLDADDGTAKRIADFQTHRRLFAGARDAAESVATAVCPCGGCEMSRKHATPEYRGAFARLVADKRSNDPNWSGPIDDGMVAEYLIGD